MAELCPKCGLLKELCVCNILDKEKTKKIRVYTEKKKFKKLVTIVEGIEKNRIKETTSDLKRKLACGGTMKNDIIILQGDHKRKITQMLVKIGYPEDAIEVA